MQVYFSIKDILVLSVFLRALIDRYDNLLTCVIISSAKPDPPENVRYVDWDVDRIDLEWNEPVRDGGARITHYTVEMRLAKAGEDWSEIGQSDGPKRYYSATGLTKGEKYQFRVRAVNKAGPSEPSEPSEPKLCKARRRKKNFTLVVNL